ncbi:MAG TPA: alpha/beta hydrolase [Anaeromyxobacteraceae bacterium]|nr:alpha/beta hydrolase [Anaeromyxobacteraceae bacterium]
MERTEHFAAGRDGTRIAWSDVGRGDPPVVLSDGIGCAGFVWRHLEPELARTHRVVHWNYRGHGRSELPRDPERVGVGDCVDDLWAVLDAAGIERAILAGHSMGVQVCLEAHRRAPRRVMGLLLVCGSYGRPIDTFHDSPALKIALPLARAAVERWPGLARIFFRTVVPTELGVQYALTFEVDRRFVPREDVERYLADLAAIDPLLFVRMLSAASGHDAHDHLSRVDVPTLVVAGEKDTFTPMWLSVRRHAAIPGSELLVLPGGTHVGPLEHPELVGLGVQKFLRDHFGEDAPADAAPPARAARGTR